MRRSIPFLCLVVGLLLMSAAGCTRKPKVLPDNEATTPTVELPPADAGPIAGPADATPSELPADIAELNEYLRRHGLLQDVYFDFDEAGLRDEARRALQKNAEFLVGRPELELTVEGHCDERGTNDYNLALGERRARAALQYLSSLGVDAARLQTLTYGEERPQCNGSDDGCWAQNRRAHFVVTGRRTAG